MGLQRRTDLRIEGDVVLDRLRVGDLDPRLLSEAVKSRVCALVDVQVKGPVAEVDLVVQLLLIPPSGSPDSVRCAFCSSGNAAGRQERSQAHGTADAECVAP